MTILVKVGKQSKLKFSRSKVYRAITASEMQSITGRVSDCHIVIIENILESEEDTVREFIDSFTKIENNIVLFYVPDNDDVTCGLADELEYDIYVSVDALYKKINDTFGVNVSTFMSDKKAFSAVEDAVVEDVNDIFGTIDTATDIGNDIAQAIEAVDNTDNTEDTSADDTALEIDSKYNRDDVTVEENSDDYNCDDANELRKKLADLRYDYAVVLADMKSATNRIEQLKSIIKALTEERDELKNNFDSIVETSDVLEDPVALSVYQKVLDDLNSRDTKIDELNKYITKLSKELRESQTRVEDHVATIAELNATIEKIEKELTDLKTYVDSGDVHETVIEKFSEQIKALTSANSELTKTCDSITAENKKLVSDIDIASKNLSLEIEYRCTAIEIIQSALFSLTEKSKELADLQGKYKEIIGKLQSASEESDTRTSEIIYLTDKNTELMNENTELSREKDSIASELEQAKQDIESRDATIDELKKTITDKDSDIEKLQCERDEADKKKEEADSKLKDKSDEVVKLTAERDANVTAISALQSLNNELAKKLEYSESTLDSVKNNAKAEVTRIKAKLELAEEQVRKLTASANTPATHVDLEDSSKAVNITANQQLEIECSTLREKISILKADLERLREDNKSLNDKVKTMTAECDGYRKALSNISTGGVLSSLVKKTVSPITYTGKSQIITVFGSGSHGTTTTAMSIAYKLCATSKVLYIDFDLVAPNADAWFSTRPILSDIPGIQSTVTSTSIGIFFEHGMGTISAYQDKIIRATEKTKGGGIDYMSGLYTRIDESKIANADYSTLFSLLGTKYDYIICDMGRLGNSEVNDSLIKELSDIAMSNIIVTTSDRFEVRNFNMKLSLSQINASNACWLLNMCDGTVLDEKVRKTVEALPYGTIMFDPAIRGHREKLFKDRTNNDRFTAFLNTAVFGRRA